MITQSIYTQCNDSARSLKCCFTTWELGIATATSKMPEIKLTYFNMKGRGEPIRYILSYLGKEFEDNRIERENWPSIKNSTPYGKLPILEIDGKVYNETSAICRYLATETNLSGRSASENIAIDQVIGAIEDLIGEIGRVRRTADPAEQDRLKQTLLAETVPFYMQRFEKTIENNGGYVASGRLSWGDLYIAATSDLLAAFLEKPNLTEDLHHLKALVEKVESQPGIKEWIIKRPVTPF